MALQKQITWPVLADEHECTACLACENICGKKAISHFDKPDGHTYVSIDKDKCIGCLKCQNVCKRSRESFGDNDLNSSKIFAAWAKGEAHRKNATSGGVFAAFAEHVLDNNGCVIGAELDGFVCKHVAIYEKKDIQRLQGSKYMASSMEDVYDILKKELPNRDVLFAGLGCQCAGVLAFMPEIKTTHNLYTVDLVCGGIPSKLLLKRFKEEYPDVTGIVSFRSKDKYELKVQTKSGEKVFSEKSLPLHGFNCGMTNRYNCYDCQFAKAHRKTDITIGDLWDYSILPDEHKRGISMVIVHSENGRKLVNSSAISIKEILWDGALLHNKRIVCGHQNIYGPRKKLCELSQNMDRISFTKLYTISMGIRDVGLFVFRAMRYVNERIISEKNKRNITTMLNRQNKLKTHMEK